MYLWTKELETGNATIDKQHKELIMAINNLLEACSIGQGRVEIAKTLDFLSTYITKHFNDEEVLQLKFKYPDYANHKQYHEGFKKVVNDISNEYQKSGATIALVGKVNRNIGDWLINHIKREDTKVAAHIQSSKTS